MKIDSSNLLERLEKMGPAINEHAKAKSERVYIEKYLKSLKALLMVQAKEKGHKTISDRECFAYSHTDYSDMITALKNAVEIEEKNKWALERLKMELEVWRSLNANDRYQKDRV